MGVEHRKETANDARRQKTRVLIEKQRPIQQPDRSKQSCPAKERGTLRQQHIHDHIDPPDPLIRQIRRRVVETGKKLAEAVVFDKIQQAKTAIEKAKKKKTKESAAAPFFRQNAVAKA